ncbi:MAG TPA: ATP-binding protein [Rhodocyclaceae bacterium]|nr:ATP-binding protein [Rhodocyclaceae bacterium]
MKHGNAAFWRLSAALAFVASLVILIGGVLKEEAANEPTSSQVKHVVAADALVLSPARPMPVSETVDEASLAEASPEGWQAVALPSVFKTEGLAPGLRTTWLRVRLDDLRDMRGPMSFYVRQWFAPGLLAVYADGHLIYRSPGSPVWNLFRHPSLLLPLGYGADSQLPKTLLLRVDWVPKQIAAVSSLYVGAAQPIVTMAERRSLVVEQIPFMFSAAFVLVGIFALGVWMFRRQYPGHLFFLIAIFSMTRRWHFQLGLERLPISDAWFVWLTLNALLWQVIATHFLFAYMHGRRQPRMEKVLLCIGTLLSLVTLPTTLLPALPVLLSLRHMAQFMIILVALYVAVAGLWNAWRARSLDTGWLVVVYVFSYVCGVYDYLTLMNLRNAEFFTLTPYSALFFSLTIIYLMFLRYVRMVDESEKVNATLEERVKARETELAASYARLREVEHHQTLSHERERLMRDMHDGLGSSLTSVLRVVQSQHGTDVALQEALKSCIDDLKLTIDSLEPVEADLLLLLGTLRYRLDPRLQSSGITLHWDVVDVPRLDWLDPSASLHILRILQETFSNILKHTQATEIHVATGVDDVHVWVSISDNGSGFDLEQARQRGGRGLANQQRRAEALQGEIRWERLATGTRMLLLLPRNRLLKE